MSDHYRTLEINRDASQNEIKSAYRRLAKKYHPDKNKSELAEQVFREIINAYEVLSNPEKKASYDKLLNTPFPKEETPDSRTRVHESPSYSKSTLKKGKVFGIVLLIIVILLPFTLLRYSSKYNYEKGLDYYSRGDLTQALIYLDRAIMEFGSRKVEASFKAINICYNNGYYSQGIVFAQKGSNYVSDKVIKGNMSFREGVGWEMMEQFIEADDAYKKAINLGYRADSVYIHLGMLHGFELEHYDESINYFDHLINTSGMKEYRLQRGIVYQKSGQTDRAVNDLEIFTNENPENEMGYFFLGISYIENNQASDACRVFRIASSKGLKESEAYIRLYCSEVN